MAMAGWQVRWGASLLAEDEGNRVREAIRQPAPSPSSEAPELTTGAGWELNLRAAFIVQTT